MLFTLTCALCASDPALLAGSVRTEPPALLEERLSLPRLGAPTRVATPLATLALTSSDEGSGHGDAHSGHMGPMWIMMGVMMAVMMVGMAVYLMRDASDAPALGPAASQSPAAVALPVSRARGAGG